MDDARKAFIVAGADSFVCVLACLWALACGDAMWSFVFLALGMCAWIVCAFAVRAERADQRVSEPEERERLEPSTDVRRLAP